MRRPTRAMAIIALISTAAIYAPVVAETLGSSSPPVILDDDPGVFLGLGIGQALERFGPPDSVAAVRGEAAWQDDVAFIYQTGYSIFLYGDKLWQIRFTKPYAGSIYGFFIGDTSDKALSILGQPFDNGPGFLVYRLPYKSYPIRLRVNVVDDRIVEAYLYRADF